ncbi:MAG: hypothetical protein V4563_07600 [Pseudomonadota bacterium]
MTANQATSKQIPENTNVEHTAPTSVISPSTLLTKALPTRTMVANECEFRDYCELRFRAVVDWAEFEICTTKTTNFWTVQQALREIQGLPRNVSPYVAGYDINTGKKYPECDVNKPSTLFRFRVQDPTNFQVLETVLAFIEAKFCLQSSSSLIAIEVALDAYNANPEQAARFYKFLSTVVSSNRRIYRGNREIVKSVPIPIATITQRLSEGWQIGIGDQPADYYQHIYWKTTDNNGTPIPDSEYRARIEITLRGSALTSSSLGDFACFDFGSLNKFFRFRMMKPGLEPRMQCLADSYEQIGERKSRKRSEGGIRLYSTLTQADTALNGRARDALKELSRRWQAQPKRPIWTTNSSTKMRLENVSFLRKYERS